MITTKSKKNSRAITLGLHEWTKNDTILCLYYTKYGTRGLYLKTEDELSNFIGTTSGSLKMQSSNFRSLMGETKRTLSDHSILQKEVFEEFNGKTQYEFMKVCKQIINQDEFERKEFFKKIGKDASKMKKLFLTIGFVFMVLGVFSQKTPEVLDSTYSSTISEEFYKKLSYEVVTKSKLICCVENPDSTYEVLTLIIPSDPVYYGENDVDLDDYYSNVLSNGQINLLTDYLVRKVRKNKKTLGIIDYSGNKIYSCLEMTGEFRVKNSTDNTKAIYGTFTFKIYFTTKIKK